jgi:predicted nuclease with TOPRIM domain
MPIDVLKELDERIQASVNKIQQLRRENEQLVLRLTESERKFQEAQAQIKQFEDERRQHESERNEVRGRIEKILARFDGIDLG